MRPYGITYLFGKEYYAYSLNDICLGRGIEIEFMSQNAPIFNFETLEVISEHFGTKTISWGDYISDPGDCSTCGYNASNGWKIFVFDITKNMPDFSK